MMSQDDVTLEGLLYGSVHGNNSDGAETEAEVISHVGAENDSANHLKSLPTSIDEPVVCAGCGGPVCDRFVLLAAGRAWHEACLRCSQCHCELQIYPTLYCRDGSIFCQQDYCRIFSIGRCARCSQPIPSSTMVMRSGDLTFHPECFSCQECDVTLLPGNLYCLQGDSVYCQFHYHDESTAKTPSHNLYLKQALGEDLQLLPHFNLHANSFSHTSETGEGEESVSSPEPRLDNGVPQGRAQRRTKRIRTCFRSEQLRAMESYFAQKHNPDGRDWSCLSHRTGLPKRVLQVWFQNARAKLRRTLSADESQSNSPAPPRSETMATASLSPVGPSHQQAQAFQTSTINHLELSLLTAPLSDPPQSPRDQSLILKDSLYLDYRAHDASCLSFSDDL